MSNSNKTKPEKPSNKTQNKSAWLTFFYVGTEEVSFSEDARRILIINLFTIVGVFFTLPLGIISLFTGKTTLGWCLVFIAVLYAINHVFLRFSRNHSLSGSFVIYPLYALMIYLVYTGGMNGTGHVWIFCVPAVSLFLHGMKQGLIELAVFTIALIIVMFFTDNYFSEFGYHETLPSRILFSFMVVIFLSGIYEYSMSRFNDELKEKTGKLKLLAYIDSLTELLNRRGMLQRLEIKEQEVIHLLLADVDFFKRVNDQYGHDAGDYALMKIAEIIQTSLPEYGFAARWGGEEFLVALSEGDIQEANALAELIRKRIESYKFSYEGQVFNVTLSVGVASTTPSVILREAITLADNRLYRAKHSGRNQVCTD
ncbi:diguanylate cyclase [Marinomonas ushuaiensis DSM 15871]|uniref:diguanylate cyclase n=1 Tax=Marinomonas ushuaiensis DSM 15871 TaxID=1122207 RepID=X7E2P4_9GAMM|nr:GGDEF domain-containing protein [Marinomonas ushuaiensis]ETX10155.1 diguanylate cyclase [Marinomonas ushuaiensis DSM 15871]